MDAKTDDKSAGKCPFTGGRGPTNREWWPDALDVSVLHRNSNLSDPMGKDFDYAKEFKTLDLKALKQGPLRADDGLAGLVAGRLRPLRRSVIRMAWHSAGTYRIGDGRGGAGVGQQRFAPLNSWPDNANLDKARRLLWPIKQKYGNKISWADLMILAGNCRARIRWASRPSASPAAARTSGSPRRTSTGAPKTPGSATSATAASAISKTRSAAVQMGLIYVNPEGPNGNPDPVAVGRRTSARPSPAWR